MSNYGEIWYKSTDGLNLYARDYANQKANLTLLCMPGLTRNSADFEDLSEALHDDYRVIAVDQRGRGNSDWDKDPSRYQPATYVQDMFTLLDEANLDDVVLVGTSLGGLMAMIMNAMAPGRFKGIVINDIGPEVHSTGLERIKSYVGKGGPVNSWADAIEQLKQSNEVAFPKFTDQDWEKFARRMFREDDKGIPQSLYDPAISKPIDEADDGAVPPDLWPVFDAMSDLPVLLIRGELTDLLHPDCVAEMQRRKPDLQVFEVPDVGHAPMLNEAGVVPAIKQFLKESVQ